jgi:RimJ/RimL family protein N-acetyltransferase
MEKIFETDRLYVRPLTPDDLEGFHEMQGNPKVMRHVGGKAMTLEENREDLLSVIQAYSRPENDFWVWAIAQRSDTAFVGTCALIVNEEGEHEIGFRFLERHWGKGYGREITAALLLYGINRLQLNEIVAYVDKENTASVRILEQTMGFEKEFYNEKEKCTDRKYVRRTSILP